MNADRFCPQCGRTIPWGQSQCSHCFPTGSLLWINREALMLITLVILGALFVATGFAAKFYHAKEAALAKDWFGRGEAALKADRARRAVEDFRTALVYARDNRQYQLRLAEALAATGQYDGALTYLQSLWEQEPGDSIINLQLARLYRKMDDMPNAIRFYHNAIYGVWRSNHAGQRRAVRLELCKFLVAQRFNNQADSEIIALVADLPRTSPDHLEAGRLFMAVKDYPKAAGEFVDVIHVDPKNADAWQGAGEAAFQLGRYVEAINYFQGAQRAGANDPAMTRMLDISRMVRDYDPFEARLSETARATRGVEVFNLALSRLTGCAATQKLKLDPKAAGNNPLETAYAAATKIQPQVHERILMHHPEMLVDVLREVGQMELASQSECGQETAQDTALLLIAKRRTGVQP